VTRELTSVISAPSQTTFSSQSSSRRHFIESLTEKNQFSFQMFSRFFLQFNSAFEASGVHSTQNHFDISSVGLLIYC
jgi:hypothetical protein